MFRLIFIASFTGNVLYAAFDLIYTQHLLVTFLFVTNEVHFLNNKIIHRSIYDVNKYIFVLLKIM